MHWKEEGLGLEIYIPPTFQLLKAAFLEGSDPHAYATRCQSLITLPITRKERWVAETQTSSVSTDFLF